MFHCWSLAHVSQWHFYWDEGPKYRVTTCCFHMPWCCTGCWLWWSSQLHTPPSGPQIPQVNTPAVESCGCLGFLARGDLPDRDRGAKTQQSSCVLRCRCHKSVSTNKHQKMNTKIDWVEFEHNRFIYYTIVSSSPGKYFSFIGHSEYVGSTTWHLNELIAEERLNYLRLSTKTERERKEMSS